MRLRRTGQKTKQRTTLAALTRRGSGSDPQPVRPNSALQPNADSSQPRETRLPDVIPFDAGLLQLQITTGAARRAGIHYVVLPDPNGITYRIVVRDQQSAAFWTAMLAIDTADSHQVTFLDPTTERKITQPLLQCDPSLLSRAESVQLNRNLRTARRGLTPASEAGCTVEVWSPEELTGTSGAIRAWSAPKSNVRSRLVRWGPEDELGLEVPWGTEPTLAPFLRDSFLSRPFPVDAVYFWVDGDDPEWQQRRKRAQQGSAGEVEPDSVVTARFRQQDELRYSMRSLEYFAPWIRRVYLLTDGQRPDWLTEDQDRVTVIDHSEIWHDSDALPTFNSRSLVSRTHHIPGLSENYLIINDDVFLGSPALPRNWFTPSGQPIFHNTSSTLPDAALLEQLPTQIHARYNSLKLISDLTGHTPTRLFQHGPLAQSKSWCAELELEFPDQYRRLEQSRFRSVTDIEPIWLHHYLGYARGRTVPGSLKYAYVDLAAENTHVRFDRFLAERDRNVFCLNDTDGAPPENLSAADQFLRTYFPVPSGYERSGS